MRIRALALSAAVGTLLAAAPSNGSPGITPYAPPPFACSTVHYFGEGQAPDLSGFPDDPLCVDYQKRDITVDNGGAVTFLLAEPARFAIALRKCEYLQTDHWSIQIDPAMTAIVSWDGSYWFDKGLGEGGVLLQNFHIEGQPAGADQVADLVQPLSSQLADQIRAYGAGPNGGGGMTITLPAGDTYQCTPPAASPRHASKRPTNTRGSRVAQTAPQAVLPETR